MKATPQPIAFERFVFVLTLAAAVALALIRVNSVDTPWHLATARLAFSTGSFPDVNTFSYTYPDYPLYQQYPVYQTVLYTVYLAAGWKGLSLLHCVGWCTIFLLWIRWGGTWRQAMFLHLPWMFCLWCLQQRMILRPDLATCFWFLLMLHLIDKVRSGSAWWAAFIPFVQWLMANSHQLFTLGLAVQILFLIHLGVVRAASGRWGIADGDRTLSAWPMAAAAAASASACLLTPLGTRILEVSAQTAGSLYHHRGDVDEFAYFYTSPWVLSLNAIAAGFGLAGLWLSRKHWRPFEVGLWLMSGVLAVAAMRGVVFFGPVSVGIFARAWARRYGSEAEPAAEVAESNGESLSLTGLCRIGMVGATLALCLIIFHFRWVNPPRKLGGTQPGLGRSLGDWPDESIQFLRDNPPPGRMLNLGWHAGNALVWGLYPQQPVFVDPRFETYPRPFLIRAIEAEHSDDTLQSLIDEFDPSWIVAEVRLERIMTRVRRLLDAGDWRLVFGDTNFFVLVRQGPETAEYLNKHGIDVEDWAPTDWLTEHPDLLRLQKERVARAYRILGAEHRAEQLLTQEEVRPQ